MGETQISLQPVDADTLPYAVGLLEANGLPSRDVRSKPDCLYVGYAGCDRVGIGGVEQFGTDGLLRSVVVEASARGEEVGTALCDALEDRARTDGVDTLYLLTTTAADFFAECGYVRVDRAAVPDRVRRTTEFEALCPDTAACLRKRLPDSHE